MKFDLDYSDYGYRDEDRNSNDEYDYSWSQDHCYVYECAYIVENGYTEVDLFPNEAEVEPGDDIHIVYVSYDTGDSFGRESGRRVHLWAFSDRKRAHQLADALTNDARANPDYDFDHKPFEFEGVPISTNEWKGYFEQFICADVETVLVRKKR